MSSGRRTPSAIKRALLAGAAAVFLSHGAAHAQAPAGPPAKAPAVSPDGLAPDELYMEADRLTRDDKAARTTAEGSVEIRYQGRTLRADRIVYEEGANDQAGVIRAYGHVQMIGADGAVEFADQLTLDDKMSAGVARGVCARQPAHGPIGAPSAVRRAPNSTSRP